MITLSRQSDSVLVISCPLCSMMNFADQKTLREIRAGKAYLCCPMCTTMGVIHPVPSNAPAPLVIDDLDRVSVATAVTARTAPDEIFGHWARSHRTLKDDDGPWTLSQRIDFCDLLYMLGEITLRPEEELCRS